MNEETILVGKCLSVRVEPTEEKSIIKAGSIEAPIS